MTRKHDAKEIAAALERIRAGESQGSVARSLGVHTSTIRIWRRRDARSVAPAAPAEPASATAPEPPPAVAAATVPEGTPDESTAAGGGSTGADLIARAMASAEGAQPEARADAAAPSDAGAAPAPAAIPAPSADDLLGMVECVNQLAVSGIVSMHGVDLDEKQFDALAGFLPRERRALRMFAPYAARYVPAVLGNFDKIAAGGFLLFWAMSLARTYKAVARLAAPDEEPDDEPAPAPASPPPAPRPVYGNGFSISGPQA